MGMGQRRAPRREAPWRAWSFCQRRASSCVSMAVQVLAVPFLRQRAVETIHEIGRGRSELGQIEAITASAPANRRRVKPMSPLSLHPRRARCRIHTARRDRRRCRVPPPFAHSPQASEELPAPVCPSTRRSERVAGVEQRGTAKCINCGFDARHARGLHCVRPGSCRQAMPAACLHPLDARPAARHARDFLRARGRGAISGRSARYRIRRPCGAAGAGGSGSRGMRIRKGERPGMHSDVRLRRRPTAPRTASRKRAWAKSQQ